jgi:hypothetical protein
MIGLGDTRFVPADDDGRMSPIERLSLSPAWAPEPQRFYGRFLL